MYIRFLSFIGYNKEKEHPNEEKNNAYFRTRETDK